MPTNNAGASNRKPTTAAASSTARSKSSTTNKPTTSRNDQSMTSSSKTASVNVRSSMSSAKPLPGRSGSTKPTVKQSGATSLSQKDLSHTMPLPEQQDSKPKRSPIKGILKKTKPFDPTSQKQEQVAASDDEQIHRQGWFPDDQEQQLLLTSTAPHDLGLSLLTASVANRTGEVVINAPAQKEDPNTKPINYRNVDWAFREFIKIQEDMIQRGHIDSAIKNLEEALNERLALYPARDEGVWKITQLLGEVAVKTAVRHLNNNELDNGLNYLKQARKFTEPLPNSDWSENPEWISMRKSVFKNMALYHQKNEEWTKALDYFKVSLKLDQSPLNPDPVGACKTSLTCAVILSRLNRYAESIEYAQSCMNQIEEQSGIDKSIPLSQYKQNITKDGTRSNGGRSLDHDSQMTTYSICMHLLGKNLANLKYFKESKVFLQRAQYVALNLTAHPKRDLVDAIVNDITNLNTTYKKNLQDANSKMITEGNQGQNQNAIDDAEMALNSIKTNIANQSISLAADFQEQKALISALMEEEEKKKDADKKQDDKALKYVKKFIDDKKKKEQESIDEYRQKIQKDFDLKQKEFMEKQQKLKQKKLMIASKNDKLLPKDKKERSASENNPGDQTSKSVGDKNPLPLMQRGLARSAAVDQMSKPGDFESVERNTRIKKSDKNLAAEGAKLDNMNLKYSSEKGNKQFFHKRRVNIEKVNEKLGFFGGGILEAPENQEVVLEGGGASGKKQQNPDQSLELEGNPYDDPEITSNQKQHSPDGKPPKARKPDDGSAVKFPPVKGYNLDQLHLNDQSENIVRKSMDTGSDGNRLGGYKNPHTRKIVESIEKKEYGVIQSKRPTSQAKSNGLSKSQPPPKKEQDSDQKPKDSGSKPLREIPTYKPPPSQQSDWRNEYRQGDDSEDELPDTKKLIQKIGFASDLHSDAIDLEEEKVQPDEDSIGAEMNDSDVANMIKQQAELEEKSKQPLPKAKPPKAQKDSRNSSQSSTRLPQLAKRFREDGKNASPEKKGIPPKVQSKSLPKEPAKESAPKTSPKPEMKEKEPLRSPPPREQDVNEVSSPDLSTSKLKKPTKVHVSLSDSEKGKIRPSTSASLKSFAKGTASSQSKNKKTEEEAKEVEPPKFAYVPPGERLKKQKEAAELKAKEEEEKKTGRHQKNKRSIKSDENDSKTNNSSKRKLDEERLEKLSQPKPVKIKEREKTQEEKEKEAGEEKAKAMINQVTRGKNIDMMSYLDRDVPAMNDKIKQKLTGPLPEASFDHSQYEIRKLGSSGHLKHASGAIIKEGGSGEGNGLQQNKAGGEFGENDQGFFNREDSKLMSGIQQAKNNALTLRGLRGIENKAAIVIQRHVKGHFTRKWYLNYTIRKKLGVPFSGLEFAQYPFLRQFNVVNQQLHQIALQPPQLIEIVSQQGDSKNLLRKSFRHGKSTGSRHGDKTDVSGDENGEDQPSEYEKHIPRRLKKGTTPQQIMDDLQKEFLAKGLDAYSQFKKMGVDYLTTEDGKPTFDYDAPGFVLVDLDKKKAEQEKVMSPRKITKALDPMERMVPKWRGEKTQQFLEVKEVAQYLDRVSRMKEYDEKQRELVKNQQFQDMARQMRKHEVTTMASFAKVHGVFNRNPNQRNQADDNGEADPLELRSPRHINAGDPGKRKNFGHGGDGGDDDDDGSDPGKDPKYIDDDPNPRLRKKKKREVQGLRDVPFAEQDGSIPLRMYQEFSRELIVFYKSIGGIAIKWMVSAGLAFEKDKKHYIPIRIYGEPVHSRNLIIVYVMNLELLKISSDYYQYNTHTFETIWPFILYLFNNWVRHQVQMIKLTNNKPLFGPEEFMAPGQLLSPRTLKQAQIEREQSEGIHTNDYVVTLEGQVEEAIGRQIEQGVDAQKQNYDELLNFSSEIEYDERFDYDQYKAIIRPEALIDRSQPADKRTSTVQLMKNNRKQLFNAYRIQLQDERKTLLLETNKVEEQLMKKQEQERNIGNANKTPEQHKNKLLYQMDKDEFERTQASDVKHGGRDKKVKLKLDDIYEPIQIRDKNPFAFFLEMHYIQLPNNKSGQYQLMKRLQAQDYNQREKSNVILPRENINIMNEERRLRLGLLPLTVIDYNCIDRAALKIKIILDCLQLRRQLNGYALAPRDVKDAYITNEWNKRRQKMIRQIGRLEPFSQDLIKAFGFHITYAKQYNEQAHMIEKSVMKINEYKQRKQLKMQSFKEELDQDVMDDNQIRQRRRGPAMKASPIKDPAQIEPDARSESRVALSEQAIMLSSDRSGGQKLGDTTIIPIENQLRGVAESTKFDRLRSQIDSPMSSQKFQALNKLEKYAKEHEQETSRHEILDEDFMEFENFNEGKREPDLQDFIVNNEIFEQSIIRIKGTLYMATLVFKKIDSNYENMKALIENRLKLHVPKSQSHQIEMLKNYKGHLRLRSKLCEFVSTNYDVLKHDREKYEFIKPQEKTMLESEMITKEKTRYKSYFEIKVTTKMSDTIWDDSFNMMWERFESFFKIFNIKWNLNDLMMRRKLNFRDRFTFFNFIGHCLSINDTQLVYAPENLDFESYKYNQIFLKLDEIRTFRKDFPSMSFYYDDYLKECDYDETEYDKYVIPYYDIVKALAKRKELKIVEKRDAINFEAAELRPNFEKDLALHAGRTLEDDIDDDEIMINGIECNIYEEKRKPELLIDEATKHFLLDNPHHNNMFNLTLTNFPESDGIFLGKVMLGSEDAYRNAFNLRIDYYAIGFLPTLQIKAYNCIYPESFEIKILHRQTIKSFIRICNLSSQSMIVNQLQSAITIGKKVTGRYIRMNFFKHSIYLNSGIGTTHGQDFMNMSICNENLIRNMLNDKYRQFSGVINVDNLGGRNLVTVSEFEIDMIQQIKGNQLVSHMNKHLSNELIKKLNPQKEVKVEKRYQTVKLWKVNMFNIANCRTYETVISYDDLHNYYETEFTHHNQSQLQKPDMLKLLSDYLRTLYIYRGKVGPLLYWRLPMYKRPIDPITGLSMEVPPDHIFKLKMLDYYHMLQRKIDGLNIHDEMSNVTPVSIDQMKAKRSKKEPPSLSLRPKLVAEKELPVYEQAQSLRVLKVTSSIIEVLLQRPKIYKRTGTLKPVMSLITILLHPMMECWIWQIYIPSNQRTFTATFYPSDLFNMNSDLFGGGQKKKKNQSSNLWIQLIELSELQRNPAGDVLLAIDNFKEPLKEILFQDHVFNENAKDMFFMEIMIKNHNNFVTDIASHFSPFEARSSKVNEYVVHVRAFSLTRNIWIKDHMPLSEILEILRKENFMIDQMKLMYYSMIKDAAILLAHKIIFSDEAKTTEIKKKSLNYSMKNITNSKEELEKLKRQHAHDIKRAKLNGRGQSKHADGLKSENKNLIDQNKIFYQGVIARAPTTQVCTIIYSDVKDVFTYRIYTPYDCTSYEKRISASEVQRTCSPHYAQMLLNQMYSQLGERIAKYYEKDMLIASVMNIVQKRQDAKAKEERALRKINKMTVDDLPNYK